MKYPFANQAKDVASTLTDYNTPAHQEVAMQEARETVVLLKNVDGTLPLSKTKKAAIAGLYADTRIVAQNGLNTPNIAVASKSPLYSILKNALTDAQLFEVADWGQNATGLQSKANGLWVTSPTANSSSVANTNTSVLYLTDSDWSNLTSKARSSTISPKLRFESNNDNTVSIVANGLAFQTGIFNGRFLTTGSDGTIAIAPAVIGNAATFNDRNDAVFH